MSGLFHVLDIARSGAVTSQGAVSITGQNITGASTPGYVRRNAVLGANAGGGVNLEGVARAFDRTTHRAMVAEQGKKGSADARAGSLARLEGVYATGGSSPIADRVQALFDSLRRLASSPNDMAARAEVLDRAGAVTEAVSSAAKGTEELRSDVAARATVAASEANDKLARIAALNAKIAQAVATGADASSLRDERDQLARDVGERIGARAIEDDKGNLTVFALGTALVDGDQASAIEVSSSTGGAPLQIAVRRPGGNRVDVSSAQVDGTLGGLRQVHDHDLPAVAAGLDRIAFDLANAINAVHQSGAGLDGGSGRPLFETPAGLAGAARAFRLDPAIVGRPERLAAAADRSELPGGNGNALRLAGLEVAALPSGRKPAETIGAFLADIGLRRADAEREVGLRTDTLAHAEALHEQGAGVSIEEEMVSLTKYQRSFEASIKVLRTVDELLQGLMQLK
jgi:flagellar hook-associated protein 1 FlgK